MIPTYISGKDVIARIDHDLMLDNNDWIAKAPLWIADCLLDLDILPALQDVKLEVTITDYQCLAPLNIKYLDRIIIKEHGIPLVPHFAINQKHVSDSKLINHATKYSVMSDSTTTRSIITFGVESGTAIFYYKVQAVETIDEYNIIMPKVIDDYHVIESIKWFIMIKLLQNGYVHPVFNLRENNEFTNPGLMYKVERKKARNSTGTMDQAERRRFSELTRELIQNYDYFYNEGFITTVNRTSVGTYDSWTRVPYATFASFPIIGIQNVVYVDQSDNDKEYIWLGLNYQAI